MKTFHFEPALDYSFMEVSDLKGNAHRLLESPFMIVANVMVSELVHEEPRRGTKSAVPPRSTSSRGSAAYVTTSADSEHVQPRGAIRLSNNNIESLVDLDTSINAIMEQPERIGWIDLSFNKLSTLGEVRNDHIQSF